MPWIPVQKEKAPVVKNIIYAVKLLYRAHRPYIFWNILAEFIYIIFRSFIQSVLFLKTLLAVIEGGYSFEYYAGVLAAFLGAVDDNPPEPPYGTEKSQDAVPLPVAFAFYDNCRCAFVSVHCSEDVTPIFLFVTVRTVFHTPIVLSSHI